MRHRSLVVVLILLNILAVTGGSAAAPPAPAPCVSDVSAHDAPDDGGGAIMVSWELATSTVSPAVTRFEVLRYAAGEEPALVGEVLVTDSGFVDVEACDGRAYQYIVRTHTADGFVDSVPSGTAVSTAQWFAHGRVSSLVAIILVCGSIIFFIFRAKSGTELFIRKIPGLDAIDDAVGRATEMGRPVLYVPGIETVSEVGTLAALTILGHVAKKVAQHGTPLLVPTADPIVMTTAQEIVKQAYAEVGQSDRFDPSSVSYLTYDQFGYTAGVNGIMVRERPEAVFLLGYFAAESLILAETAHEIGAIQISGTKETSQLPFFVAACDYTLIGEEIFAASSYLSHEPVMLGSLKGQDLIKIAIVYLIVGLVILSSIGYAIAPDGTSVLSRSLEAVRLWLAGS